MIRLGAALFSLVLACGTGEQPHKVAGAPASPPDSRARAQESPAPRVTRPVRTDASQGAHEQVETRLLGHALPANPLVHFTPIEDREGTPLKDFYRALRSLTVHDGEPPKVRVAIYGSSSVAADRYTGYLRGYLQYRFGDGGIGHVAAVPLWKWHRHNEVQLTASRGWTVAHGQQPDTPPNSPYGLLGALVRSQRPHTNTRIRAPSRDFFSPLAQQSQLTLYYLRQPSGGHFSISLDHSRGARVSTAGPDIAPDRVSLRLAQSVKEINIRVSGDGEVGLLGLELERDTPGVVVDSLGIGGTRAANMLLWNEAQWATLIAARDPALYILAYGANEAVDEDEPIETYQSNLEQVIERFQHALPNASCVLIGPADFLAPPPQDQVTPTSNAAEQAQWVARPRLGQIIAVQRAVSARMGCGFFDTQAFMGGPGSMNAWVAAQLAKSDHLHLTKLGYLYLGQVFADALMAQFDLDAPGGETTD